MNKQGLVKAIANATGMNQQQAGEALDAITSSIQSVLAAGESVAIPESRVPVFKAGKQLKAAL